MLSCLPLPPSEFDPVPELILKKGKTVFRISDKNYPGDSFNPTPSDSRFTPLRNENNGIIPSLYAAGNAKAAAFEVIFRNIEPEDAIKAVNHEDITINSLSTMNLKKDVKLFEMTRPTLQRFYLDREKFFTSKKSIYDQTRRWAQAIHKSCPDIGGLAWTSVRCDPESCYLFFGDRVTSDDFEVTDSQQLSLGSLGYRQVHDWGRAAGITIIGRSLPPLA